MLALRQVHHIAIIGADYAASKRFYCDILGFTLLSEVYREERGSWKADLALNGQYTIELFSFPSPPARVSRPEAAACAIWRSASTTSIRLSLICRRPALPANRCVSIPTPNPALPFSAIPMVYR